MSTALRRTRDHLEATPRSLDNEQMTRLVRGDRGCLGDSLSAFGVVVLVGTLILSGMGMLGFSWVYVGVALFVGGFVVGSVAQGRSGKVRQAALESGSLVLGVVARSAAWLRRPGKRVGRVVMLFTVDPERRFDRGWLEGALAHLETEKTHLSAALQRLLDDSDAFECVAVPPEYLPAGAPQRVYLGALIVHPERLEGRYLGGDDDREAHDDGDDDDLDGPERAPTVLAIVGPSTGFVEHMPILEFRPEEDRSVGQNPDPDPN